MPNDRLVLWTLLSTPTQATARSTHLQNNQKVWGAACVGCADVLCQLLATINDHAVGQQDILHVVLQATRSIMDEKAIW